jgi:hypothetical protein
MASGHRESAEDGTQDYCIANKNEHNILRTSASTDRIITKKALRHSSNRLHPVIAQAAKTEQQVPQPGEVRRTFCSLTSRRVTGGDTARKRSSD